MLPLFAAAPPPPAPDPGVAFAGTFAGLACIATFCVLAFLVEMLPAIIAAMRGHPSTLGIAVLCFFLSWTGIVWILAMVWACSDTSTSGTTVVIAQRPRRRSRRDDYDD